MRHLFGGSLDAWTFDLGDDATSQAGMDGFLAIVVPARTVTFWDSAAAGTQYTDLQDLAGAPITAVSSDGAGEIPQLRGPDEVWSMWADANGGAGPRRLIQATDVGDTVAANQARLDNVENTVAALSALAAVSVVTVAYDEVAGTWPVRPVIAGSRIVFWFGPNASPPPAGYMTQNDQFFGWQA